MTEVWIRYAGALRQLAGIDEEHLTLPVPATLGMLVDLVCSRHGAAVRDLLLSTGGHLRDATVFVVDGAPCRNPSALLPPQPHVTVLALSPFMVGG